MTPNASRLRERFDADPSDRAAFEGLEEQLFVAAQWTELVGLYEAHLEAAGERHDAGERARLLFRLAQALSEDAGDGERVLATLRAALALDPAFEPAQRRLRALVLAHGALDEAISMALAAETPTSECVAALAEIGERALAQQQPAVASRAFEAALARSAGEPRALLGAARSFEAMGRLQEAVAVWERARSTSDAALRSRATEALGALLEGPLADLEGALQHFQRAVAEDPDEPRWLDALFELLVKLERPQAAAALGQRRFEKARDPEHRAAIALAIGRLHLDALRAPADALFWLQRAVEESSDGAAHLALAEVAGQLGDASGRLFHLERAMELGAEIPAWSDLGLEDESDAAANLDELRRAVARRPGDPDALDALAAALATRGEHVERVEILARRARLAGTEPAECAELWFEIGELRIECLADPAGAVEAFTNALAADPARALGVDALDAALRRLGRVAELAGLLAPVLAAAPPGRRAALQCRLGEAALERADAPAALVHFRAALDADPRSERAQAGLARAAEGAGNEPALFELWSREAARCDLERLAALGRGAFHRALESDEPERALLVLQRWAERAGTREALEALATLLGEIGRSDELLAVLEALDPHLAPAERAAYRRRHGYQLAAEGRADEALAAWRQALRHDPGDAASFEALASALAESGDDAALVALFELRDDAAPRAPLAESLIGRALERSGRGSDALHVLRALAASGAADDAAAEAFERVARRSGDPHALAAALALRSGGAGDPTAAEQRALELAELLDVEIDDSAAAQAAYRALERDGRDAAVRMRARVRLDALLERGAAIQALCERLAERIAGADARDAFALHCRIADLAEARLADPSRARRHLEAAVALDPHHAALWRRLEALADSPAARLRTLEGELGARPERERELALQLAIAQLARHELADDTRADLAYRAALAIEPGEPEANAFCAAQCAREGRLAELADLLGAQAAASATALDPAFLVELQLRRAALLREQLNRPDEAIDALRGACAVAGPIPAVAEPLAKLLRRAGRNEECAELCEAAAQRAPEPSLAARFWALAADACGSLDEDARAARCLRRACEAAPAAREPRTALILLSRRQGDYAALVPLLERELEEPGCDALALHCELVLRCAALGRAGQACDHALAAAALAPFDASLREPALERAIALGRADAAASLLLAAAEDARAGERAALWRRRAELLAERDPEAAVASFARSLELEPRALGVREARRMLLERLDRPAEALVELEAEIEVATASDRALRVAHGADLALRAHGATDAVPWLARLAAEGVDDAPTWSAIALRYGLAGMPQAQERALHEAELRSERPADAAALARERAALLEGPLAEPGRALAAWQMAHGLAPGDPATLAALDRLYTRSGRTREALGVLECRAAQSHGEARAEILVRAAAAADSLGERALAAAFWRDALAADLLRGERRVALLPNAAEAQRRAGELTAFVALAEEELLVARDAAREAVLHRELARIWRDGRARPDRALSHLRALVDSDHAEPADRDALLNGLRAIGARGELAERLAEQLRRESGDAAAWRELAVLREEALWDPDGAAEAWRALARLEPDSAPAVAGLRRASQRSGDARALDAALEREIELGAVDAAAAWRELGALRRKTLRDLAGAERAWAAALALDGRHLETLSALRELAEARADWDRALTLGEREIECVAPADTARRQALWLHRAACASGAARDLAVATRAFEEADAIAALPAATLGAWAAVLHETGPAARWREVFGRACDHSDAKAEARDHLALAQALADAGRHDAAADRLRAVFAQEPEHAGAWALVARLREASGDAEGICEAWSHAARATTGLDAARAWRSAAAPFERGNAPRALALLERAVEAYPSFAPAHAARAIATERLGRHEDAIAAARAALDGRGISAPLLREEHREAARAGARAAHALERWSDAWQLASEALAVAPREPDALLAQGIAALHLGSASAARRALEAWLDEAPLDAPRAAPIAALGDALVALGEGDAARARYDEALALDPNLDRAHRGVCALLETRGDTGLAAEALARWAACPAPEPERAERWLGAARLAGVTAPRARAWLESAITAHSDHADAWRAWLEHLEANGSEEERLAAAERGAAQVSDPRAAAQLEIVRARLLETRGDERGARDAFVRAVELDASIEEAAFAAARLLRASGDWSAAAACLGAAVERQADPVTRALLLAERGRLCAGPLEDLSAALGAYRQACDLAPDRAELREAFAAVLAQQPDGRASAQAELRTAIAMDPVRPTAWRRLGRLLREDGREHEASGALALLAALGAATAIERESAPPRLDFAIDPQRLDDATGEALREALLAIAGDWAEALGEAETSPGEAADPALASVARSWRAACAERVGPALAALDVARFAAQAEALIWTALGKASSLEATRETRAVVERISARALRRLRRGLGELDLAALGHFDFTAFAVALRALALAAAVDRNAGDLRAALGCARAETVRADGELLPAEADLTPLAASPGIARALLAHAVRAWLAAL